MPKCSTCGLELQLSQCPDCGTSALLSASDAKKSLNRYSLLLAPGLLGGLLGYIVYPPLDSGPLVALGLCLFSLPFLLQVVSLWRRRLCENLGRLRTAYAFSSLALTLLAGLVLMNGWLDGSAASTVRTTVIRKTATRERGRTTYHLDVSSWRSGRSDEEFRVEARAFNRAVVGKTVSVELHAGFFGLPWSGRISPE